MGNWRNSFPGNYLKAANVEQPKLLTIKRFTTEEISGEHKPVIYFDETDQGLVLNVTNGNNIERITGTADTDGWVGQKVVLFAAETDFQGKTVPCIHVRAPKPGAKAKPAPPPEPDDEAPF